MMDRRNMLAVGGALAMAALAGKAAAQPMTISGTVEFEGGEPIPAGELRVFVDGADGANVAKTTAVEVRQAIEGKTISADFSLAPPQARAASGGKVEVVATLERADGWLLARGSDQVEPGTPAVITLYTVMY